MARKPAPTKSHAPNAPEPVQLFHFVPSTDAKVTSCEAWKSLMQFRHELGTNPLQDSGINGWWSKWVGTMQRWLFGGGDWGCGYYGPEHREVTPDAAVCLDSVKRRLHYRFRPDNPYTECAGDNDRTMFFPANTTYHYNGFVIDWTKPFPPIAERRLLIEWVESWIDRIQYTESTGHYPWEDFGPTPTPDPAILAGLEVGIAAVQSIGSNFDVGVARLERVIEELGARDTTPKPPKKPKPTRRERRVKWLAEAMLTVRDHPEWSDANIAERVDIDKSRLSRTPEYQAAARMARTPKMPDGSVTIAEGDRSVEAVDDSVDLNRPGSRQWQHEEDIDERIDREIKERNAKRNGRH